MLRRGDDTSQLPEAPVVGGAALGLVAVGTIFALGMNWPIMSVGVEDIAPLWLTSMRLLGAGAVVGAIMAVSGRLHLPRRSDYAVVLSVGVLRLAVVTSLVFSGLAFVPPGRSTVLVYTSSLWTAPLAAWLLRERLNPAKLGAVAVGILGVVLLVEPWATGVALAEAAPGYVMLLCAAVGTSLATVHIRGHRWTGSPLALMPWQLLLAGTLTTVAATLIEGAPVVTWDGSAVAIVAYQIFVATSFGLWGTLTVSRSLPALSTSLLLMAVPVVGVTGSVLFVDEALSAAALGGMACVLGGVGLSVLTDHLARRRR